MIYVLTCQSQHTSSSLWLPTLIDEMGRSHTSAACNMYEYACMVIRAVPRGNIAPVSTF